MYTIGDIARLGGVSARTLRHYDEIGLFRPAAVDANGLAYYEDDPDGGGIIVHAAASIPSDVTAIDGVAVVDLEPVDQAVCCLHLGDMSSVDDTVMAMLE